MKSSNLIFNMIKFKNVYIVSSFINVIFIFQYFILVFIKLNFMRCYIKNINLSNLPNSIISRSKKTDCDLNKANNKYISIHFSFLRCSF